MRQYILFLLLLSVFSLGRAQEIVSYDDKFKFIENKGQWPNFVFFRAESNVGKIYLEQNRILYQFLDLSPIHRNHANQIVTESKTEVKQELISVEFLGSNHVEKISKSKRAPEYRNYFQGQDSSNWVSHAYAFADVVLHDIYNKVDLHYNNSGEHLKYEFIVKPGGNPSQILMQYHNAKSIKKTKDGRLKISGELGLIEEGKPFAYQVVNGKIVEIQCSYELEKNQVRYKLGNYDEKLELIIDPELIFASYSGSQSDNFGMTATYDYEGNLFSGGIVFGNSYPTTAGAYDENGTFTQVNAAANQSLLYGITDIFISKYSADGTTLLYSTYIGGGTDLGGVEVCHSLICNEANELYFFGTSSSSDFPMVNPVQGTFNGGLYREFTSNGTHYWGNNQSQANGGTDLIVVKLAADGSQILASTYYGGSQNDGLNYNENGVVNGNTYGGLMYNYGDPFRGEIMLDEFENVYVATCTYSANFPLVNPVQGTFGGNQDGVLVKFAPNLTSVIQSTYWGGSQRDACFNVKFDSSNNLYLAGGTLSPNFNTTSGAFQENLSSTTQPDGFVSKFSSSGNLLASTLIGTTMYDQVFFIQVDRFDFLYVLGQTRGSLAPSPGTFSNPNSGQFIMKFENDLEDQVWQTVFGNGNSLVNISPTAFLVDVCGNIYVSGWGGGIAGSMQQSTSLNNMPISPDALQSSNGDGYNFYLIVLSAEAESLLYASYLGGGSAQEHVDGGTSRFDELGVVYHSACGGCGGHSDFPTSPADVWSLTNNSANCNNLVFKFDFKIVPQSDFTIDIAEGCAPFTVDFINLSSDTTDFIWDFGNGIVIDNVVNPVYTFTEPGTYEATLVVNNQQCGLSDTSSVVIIVQDELLLDLPEELIFCNDNQATITASSLGTADNFHWSSMSDFSDMLNANPNDSSFTTASNQSGTYYIQVSNENCELIDSLQVTFLQQGFTLSGDTILCLDSEGTVQVSSNNPAINFTNVWSPQNIIEGPNNQTSVTIQPTNSGYLYVDILSDNGCQIQDSVFIQVIDLDLNSFGASAIPDSVPIGGASINFIGNVSPGQTFFWQGDVNFLDPTALNTSAFVDEATTVFFIVNEGPCEAQIPIPIKLYEPFCEDPFIYVPNAFSPNLDGNNDVLFVRGNYIEKMIFRVYNRWGEMVFESTDPNIGWDGTFNGEICLPDVYDYYLDVDCTGGLNNIITGNVTLVE